MPFHQVSDCMDVTRKGLERLAQGKLHRFLIAHGAGRHPVRGEHQSTVQVGGGHAWDRRGASSGATGCASNNSIHCGCPYGSSRSQIGAASWKPYAPVIADRVRPQINDLEKLAAVALRE